MSLMSRGTLRRYRPYICISFVAEGMTGRGKSDSWMNEYLGDDHGIL